MSVRWCILCIALVAAVGCSSEDRAPREFKTRLESALGMGPGDPSPDEVRAALLQQLRSQPRERASSSAPFPSREAITEFYSRRGHRLVWSDGVGKIAPATPALLEALRHAGDEGLDPQDYAVDRLEALEREVRDSKTGEETALRLANFDLLATTAFFRFASDLSTGRVHPDEVQSDWHTNPPELDLVQALGVAIEPADLSRLLASLPPPHAGYARLREALGRLREIEAAGGWATIPAGAKLEKGSSGWRVGLLRQRLGAPPGDRFDDALASAVGRFQELHGIEPDGVAGRRTLEELNVPAAERIRQVELNLERWRWIPRSLGDPHVVVNIPGFELALERGDAPVWRTRVVTGKAFTPTPVFSDQIVAVVVDPPWNVPESIAVGEYLPELIKDRNALARHELRVLEGSGDDAREIDPRKVDWRKVDAENFPYRLRQDPGEKNPLGRIKFVLTNDFQIYLHDTPAGGLFGRTERDLSHGCIRVEKALDLANEIVGDVSREKIRQALEEPEEPEGPGKAEKAEGQRVDLESRVPVHIFYWTAWVDEAGELHFGPDVYGFDPPQQAALDRAAGSPEVKVAIL